MSSTTKVFCPKCGAPFEAQSGHAGKKTGAAGGAIAGAIAGANVGIVAGPLGGIAGTVPGAVAGGLAGSIAGAKLDQITCPICSTKFSISDKDEEAMLEELRHKSGMAISVAAAYTKGFWAGFKEGWTGKKDK